MKIEEAKMIFSKYFKDSPGKDFVMSVMDSIEIPPTKEEAIRREEQLNKIGEENDYKEKCRQDYELRHAKPKPQKVDDYPQKPKKKKVCESCGKEFYPNSGVQKLCLECRRQKADISKTAREMLEL
jgi:hypothetical protein